jgi:tetraacyldisaccharide 4'-kinase
MEPREGFVGGWGGYALERLYLAGLNWSAGRALKRGPVRAAAPVISIGNLVVGGTGKTPCTIWTAQALQGLGARVAVVARPVGGAVPGGAGDEVALLAERLPGARVVAARVKSEGTLEAASALRAEPGPCAVIVDDGFSHRALARDLDIVLVDAARPIGNGHLLPRGLLREPPTALARAQVVIATRADRVPSERLAETLAALERLAPSALVAAARLEPLGLSDGAEVTERGTVVVCLSGLARAGELAASARALGLSVATDLCYPDHHRFGASEFRRAEALAREARGGLVVSAKDAVRLTAGQRARVRVLEVAWRFVRGEDGVRERLKAVALKGTP